MSLCLVVIWIFLLVPLQATSQNSAHKLKIYTNVRFQYAICYPPDALQPQGEAPNSDGQGFMGKKGEHLIVYGSNQQTNLPELEEVRASELEGKTGTITYRARQAHSFVLSGQKDETTFYSKTFLTGDQFKTFELSYPFADKQHGGELARILTVCFTDLARSAIIKDPYHTGANCCRP